MSGERLQDHWFAVLTVKSIIVLPQNTTQAFHLPFMICISIGLPEDFGSIAKEGVGQDF